jgi:hypothetical protein
MNKVVSLAILAGGILLTIFGVAASKSFSSDAAYDLGKSRLIQS